MFELMVSRVCRLLAASKVSGCCYCLDIYCCSSTWDIDVSKLIKLFRWVFPGMFLPPGCCSLKLVVGAKRLFWCVFVANERIEGFDLYSSVSNFCDLVFCGTVPIIFV